MTDPLQEELVDLAADAADGIMTLLDVMAGEPPEGFDKGEVP